MKVAALVLLFLGCSVDELGTQPDAAPGATRAPSTPELAALPPADAAPDSGTDPAPESICRVPLGATCCLCATPQGDTCCANLGCKGEPCRR